MTIIGGDLKPVIATEAIKKCPVCQGSGDVVYRGLKDRLNNTVGEWSFICCKCCGTLWLDPRPLYSEINKLYMEYYTHERGNKSDRSKHTIKYIEDIKEFILPRRRIEISTMASMLLGKEPPGKLLDIGCGDGNFLALMQKRGWDVVGVEPDSKAAQIAMNKFNLKVYNDVLDNIDFTPGSFDAITLSHVFEHIANPDVLLKQIGKLLKSKGLLAIATPNVNSLGHRIFKESWHGLEPPRHFILFNLFSLEKLLIDNGFRVKEHGTFSRMASGIFALSIKIKKSNYVLNTLEYTLGEKIFRTILVLLEHWVNLITGDQGEEIGVLAEKV